MSKLRQIALIAFDGFQILDITGPASVFAAANNAEGKERYQVSVISANGGNIQSNCGIEIATKSMKSSRTIAWDTVLIAGGKGEGLEALCRNATAMRWILKAAQKAHRFGSICSGTFVLGHLGLLDKRKVTTHWAYCNLLTKQFPKAIVDSNALYIIDGNLWTSAGVTTGIDMSLGLVAKDLGSSVANTIAKRLVLYARRPGYQSQFSPVLGAQSASEANNEFTGLIEWIQSHLNESLDIPVLADFVFMSERNFYRKFTQCVGQTPARYVEALRLERCRELLSSGLQLKQISALTGYKTPSQLTKAFERRFGISPTLFRETQSITDS
jgi:transcriptional regulator GlxA family with amidase domain